MKIAHTNRKVINFMKTVSVLVSAYRHLLL